MFMNTIQKNYTLMKKDNLIKNKSFEFALDVVKLNKYLVTDQKEYVLSKQLLRSGTSIGSLVRESEHEESKADFIHKLSIALKEANESEYWLELLFASEYITKAQFEQNSKSIESILKILISIIKTSKTKLKS